MTESLLHVSLEMLVIFGVLSGLWWGWVWLVQRLPRPYEPPRGLPPPCQHRFVRMFVTMDFRGEELARALICVDCQKPVPLKADASRKEHLQ
jgi:hypothetical protein